MAVMEGIPKNTVPASMNWDDFTPEERLKICGVPYPKVNVCCRPEYRIQFEQLGVHTFGHMSVERFTPRVKERIERDFNTLQDLLEGPVLIFCDNPKLCKFCTMFGFEHFMDATTVEGEPATILIRKWKNNG